MDASTLVWVAVVAGIVGFMYLKGILDNGFKTEKGAMAFGIALVGIAVLLTAGAFKPAILESIPGVGDYIAPDAPLYAGGDSPGTGTGNPGTSTGTGTNVGSTAGLAVSTLSATSFEAGSNSYTAPAGSLKFFPEGSNPSDPTAQPVDTVTIAAGVGSSTNKALVVGQKYRVVFNGNTSGNTYYDKDMGIVTLGDGAQGGTLNSYLGTLTFQIGEVQLVGTLDDILDETSTTGIINGQTTNAQLANASEINYAGTAPTADATMYYNETAGDGNWYIQVTPSCSGANKVCRQAVLQFVWDLTNPPEGNEYSSITAQSMNGANLGVSDALLNYWTTQSPIALGDMKAGTSGTYKITFSEVPANEDSNDDWTLRFDDLGKFLGKDVLLSTRATADAVTYGGSQT